MIKKNGYIEAVESLLPNCTISRIIDDEKGIIEWGGIESEKPTQQKQDAALKILRKEKPLRLLRIERDKLLAQTDWQAVSDRTIPENVATYRAALRNLPGQIKSGVLPAPTLDENDQLVWDHWPVF